MPDNEARTMGEIEEEFDNCKRAFHDTVGPLGGAMEALIRARAKQKFPGATKVVLFGQMKEDFELGVHVIRIEFPDRIVDENTENVDAVTALEEFDELCWDALSYCDIFGDDYYDETEIDL